MENKPEDNNENETSVNSGLEVADVSVENEESSDENEVSEVVESSEIEAGAEEIPKNDNPALKWYVVHVYSTCEEKAKMALLERIKMFKVERQFGEILIPKINSSRVLKSGKTKVTQKTSFPGYMLVEIELNEQTNHVVCHTPKITGFVGSSKNPRPVSESEVIKLVNPTAVDVADDVKDKELELVFEKGESVKVIDGAFTNFDGVVELVHSDRKKLRILVSIFGRETPVELDYTQVQQIK